MTKQDIINLRLQNLQITNHKFKKPEDLVAFLGAVQSQDFIGAKWALGLRLPESKDWDIEKPFNEGRILRTHALRPTWHFVAPQDIRWLVELNAPQVKKIMGYYNRVLELDEKIFQKTNQIIESALRGKNLTRTQLSAELKKHGITGTGQRIGHIVSWAELDGIICSGPRLGKQFSYALIDEVAPKVKKISRDEALAKLAKIFFETRGPATVKDLSKWSGLSMIDAKKGLNSVKSHIKSEEVDGLPAGRQDKIYWFFGSLPTHSTLRTFLLPNYDEYISSYADYSVIADLEKAKNLEQKGNALFWNHIVINGILRGSWRRTFDKDTVKIEISPFTSFTKDEMKGIEKAGQDFGKFLGFKVLLF